MLVHGPPLRYTHTRIVILSGCNVLEKARHTTHTEYLKGYAHAAGPFFMEGLYSSEYIRIYREITKIS